MPHRYNQIAQTLAILLLLTPRLGHADEVTTEILESGYHVVVDGLIDEWRDIPSQQLKIVDKTSYKGESDFAASVQSLYDKDYLFFSVTVHDDTFVRTTLAGNGEDKVVFWFGTDAKGSKSTALSIYPADLNGTAGQDLRFGGKKVSPAKAGKREIEALESFVSKENRWMVEVAVPWEKLPAELRPLESIPFCVAVFDGDDKSKPRVEAIASNCSMSKTEPTSLGGLVISEHRQIMESFLQETKLSRSDITLDTYADAGGDDQVDRVIVAGTVFGILGMGLDDGHFYYYRLGLRSASDLKGVQLMDVDGDGKQNIVTRSLEYDSKNIYSQEIIRVLGIKGGALTPIFGQEVADYQPGGSVSSKYEWKKKGKGLELTITQAVADGVEQAKYIDMDSHDAKDYEEILLPWDTDKKKTYRFVKGSAELVK